MPLPLIIGGIAAVAGVAGIGSGIHGGVKMKNANDTMKNAQKKQERAVARFETNNKDTNESMDALGKLEKIQGRPDFKELKIDGVDLPSYEAEELKKVSAGAGVLLGGLGGAAVGTAGGFAAAGATTSAVMALGTASTGTAISSLSGAALTNATLAALGGGALYAGGGGMALGSAVLGGATLGVGLLVGGVIFNITGTKLSNKADEAYEQAQNTENQVNTIVEYLTSLRVLANGYKITLEDVNEAYQKRYKMLENVVDFNGKTHWNDFTENEKLVTQNAVLLVGLLYKMCQVNLVLKTENKNGFKEINKKAVKKVTKAAEWNLRENFKDGL